MAFTTSEVGLKVPEISFDIIFIRHCIVFRIGIFIEHIVIALRKFKIVPTMIKCNIITF